MTVAMLMEVDQLIVNETFDYCSGEEYKGLVRLPRLPEGGDGRHAAVLNNQTQRVCDRTRSL